MANVLLTIALITREALRVLENNLTFTKLVNRQYDDRFGVEGAKIGTTLNVRKPPRYLGRVGQAINIENSVETQVPVVLNRCGSGFAVADDSARGAPGRSARPGIRCLWSTHSLTRGPIHEAVAAPLSSEALEEDNVVHGRRAGDREALAVARPREVRDGTVVGKVTELV